MSTPDQDTSTKPGGEDDSTVTTTSNKEQEEEDPETSSEPEESPNKEPPQEPKEKSGPSPLLKKPSMLTSLVRRPPKMRIKLSLRKLPTLANRKEVDKLAKAKRTKITDDDGDDLRATVVDSDEAGDDEAVAAVVGEPTSSSGTNKPIKRRSTNPSRAIKMPPLASPGLLMTPPTSNTNATKGEPKKVEPKKGGFVAPSQVFDQTMEQAGYTIEARTKNPHRGSSVTRTVGDMFDSNVALTLRFPFLVPPELLKAKPTAGEENGSGGDRMQVDGDNSMTLPQLLIEVLRKKESATTENGSDHSQRKRKRPCSFYEMAPVSLTLPYPEEFVEKRIKYVQDVDNRERAIVDFQEAELLSEQQEGENGGPKPKVPPIPQPPTPPKLQDMKNNFPVEKYDEQESNCFPKGKESYVTHLDPSCFHISEGRYFGLSSNFIADPNYVGPNAPGLAGMSSTGGSGLATSSSGGGISGAMALTLSTTYNGTIAGSEAALRSTSSMASPTKTSLPVKSEPKRSSPKVNGESYVIGPKPTASALDLKKIFDEDENSDLAKSMKDCIIRAAVHASRSGRHGQSFRAPNGEIYPDITKAFFSHGGMKPCQRCKSNKQGAYHCRLRRRHKELDYDGGDSASFLAPFFTAPMDSLVCRGDS